MPRQAKGAYLWLRPDTYDKKTGKLYQRSTWLIRDGRKPPIATGCSPGQAAEAEKRLAQYIADKHQPERKHRELEVIDIADVLAIYDEDKREGQKNKRTFDGRIERLASWWGGKMLSQVTGDTCRAYAEHRSKAERQAEDGKRGAIGRASTGGGARRDLEDLRAAINHHHKQGLHREVVLVTLPDKGGSRDRWLTRSEAAKLIWHCWRYRDEQTRNGRTVLTKKRSKRHIARFILIGLYTGTRAGAIATASPYREAGSSWVDLDAGLFYRLAEGKKASNKRQPTIRLPSRLLAHLRRWSTATKWEGGPPVMQTHFVEWRSQPVASIKHGLQIAVEACELPGVITPHTLRHTAATWLMQRGADKYETAGYLGMSLKMLDEVYGHHHPDFQVSIDEAFSTKRHPKQAAGPAKALLEKVRSRIKNAA